MSKVVYKYPLAGVQTDVDLPAGAQVLHVEAQRTEFCLWALVDPEQPSIKRTFVVLGTGHPYDDEAIELRHISSFLVDGGLFVFHAFEEAKL